MEGNGVKQCRAFLLVDYLSPLLTRLFFEITATAVSSASHERKYTGRGNARGELDASSDLSMLAYCCFGWERDI